MNASELLTEVQSLILTDRRETHGDAGEQMDQTARLWSAYLGMPITREQVAVMNQLQKISRSCHGTYNPDDYKDCLGYGTWAAIFASLDRR